MILTESQESERILAVATLTVTAAAFEAATLNFIAFFPQIHRAKFKINSAVNAISQIREISSSSHKITLKESKTLKKETFGAGGLVYEFLQLLALIPDDRVDEMELILKKFIKPMTVGAKELLK
jgi:hypothetical protein